MSQPDFSVIITTRNRPVMFEAALKSVLSQTGVELEVVVVNDGSSETYLPAYKELEERYTTNVKFIYLISSLNGHGPCYAANQGVRHSRGEYIAFLDDDDVWIDQGHIKRVAEALVATDGATDLFCSSQEAWIGDHKLTEPVWLERNEALLLRSPIEIPDVYKVDRVSLVNNGAFAHVNTTIYRRDFFLKLGGFDENLRYEGDREFFMRAVDATEKVLFTDKIVSKHHVPDPTKSDNMSTAIQDMTKLQYQLTLYTKLLLTAKSSPVLRQAKAGHGYTLKHLTAALVKKGDFKQARRFAGMALLAQFSFKWLGYYSYLQLRSLF